MKRINCLFVLLSFAMVGCSGSTPSSSSLSSINPSIESSEETSSEEISSQDIVSSEESSSSEVDYGKVSFSNVFVYSNDYDGVIIRPIFTNPEACKDEVFEYEIADDTKCYIENDEVKYLSEGYTKVTARSQHLRGSFMVFTSEKFDFQGQANTHRNRMINSYQEGDTLFLGDSFFEFWRNGTNNVTTFDKVFEDYKVFNIGISATTTHDWRAMNQNVVSLATAPKNIVINIGINNVDDDKEGGKVCSQNIQNMIYDYLDEFPETNIYYLSITRCAGYFAFNWESHEASNTAMEIFCEKTDRVHYLDVMALYGDNYASYQADGLHPNQAGYQLFEQIIKENVPLEKK